MLETTGLTIGYKDFTVARNLDLRLEDGSLVCLLGPNGVGKSTLLRTLAGMQKPLAGSVRLNGESLHAMKPQALAKQLSIVTTERIDVGLLTGYDLVALGRFPYTDWQGRLTTADKKIIDHSIISVRGEALAQKPVGEMSDGERQKMMIARALAQSPAVMLLDEPTAFLDLPRRAEVMQILRNLALKEKKAIMLSTHDLDLALRNADKIWLMMRGSHGQGKVHVGTPEDLVLNGRFEEAFASEGVRFDKNSGGFSAESLPTYIPVALSGNAPHHLTWTQRALERAGYQVVEPSKATVSITYDDGQWTIDNGQVATSIEELLQALRR